MQAARETGALKEAKDKLEKRVEELTWRIDIEKHMRVDSQLVVLDKCQMDSSEMINIGRVELVNIACVITLLLQHNYWKRSICFLFGMVPLFAPSI